MRYRPIRSFGRWYCGLFDGSDCIAVRLGTGFDWYPDAFVECSLFNLQRGF